MRRNLEISSIPRLTILVVITAAITAQHYFVRISHENMGLHNIHYLLYFLPILMASIWFGIVGGITSAIVISILYAPVVFGPLGRTVFTSNTQKVLELVIYNIVGFVTGLLSEREKREREGYRRAAEELQKAYGKLREQTHSIVEKEEQLRRAERLSTLGELAAEITHEIRNPLASIKGTAEILQDPSTPYSKREEFSQLMLEEVNRLNHVIENFLELARFQRLHREKTNVNEILERILQIFDFQLGRKNITARTHFASDLPDIQLDASQMEQAVLNLLLNAVAAMPDGGMIELTTELHKIDGSEKVLIEIADTGAGISPEHLPYVFNPFFTTRSDGTGLGLSIVRRILKAHGGSVEISSETGKGTRVTLVLPTNSEAGT
jgi:two-component system sensor histidine kinase HydH